MISSMTGYGRAEGETSLGHLLVEIKSVNHRFLDSRVRLPRQISSLEPHLLSHLKNNIARGRVEVALTLAANSSSVPEPVLNLPLAQRYYEAAEKAADALALPGSIGLDFILRMPDVLQVSEPVADLDQIWEEIRLVVDQAVRALGEMRAREGKELADDFRRTLTALEEHRARLETSKDKVVSDFRDRFEARLKNLLSENGGLDPTRLHQEVAIFAERCDVSEELARLDSHLKQFEEILRVPEPVGRRLDFLLQEMFREINTIGSKANHLEVTQTVLQMKNLVERLREQAQNVE
ncbi:MAG: hypothetical protein GHCLOJNM_00906 [bacterium]|nr:hypothetical protein [bacterium]